MASHTVLLNDDSRSFTAYATEAIEIGDICKSTSGDDQVGLAGSTYAASDIQVGVSDDGGIVVGIATNAAASGAAVSVLTEGIFIASGNGITAGNAVASDGAQGFTNLAVGSCMGRALTGTSAAAGKYFIGAFEFKNG